MRFHTLSLLAIGISFTLATATPEASTDSITNDEIMSTPLTINPPKEISFKARIINIISEFTAQIPLLGSDPLDQHVHATCAHNGESCVHSSTCCGGGQCAKVIGNAGLCKGGCEAVGMGCQHDGTCCSGKCELGTCRSPCVAVASPCEHDGACCSGLCAVGTCRDGCSKEGVPCVTDHECCNTPNLGYTCRLCRPQPGSGISLCQNAGAEECAAGLLNIELKE